MLIVSRIEKALGQNMECLGAVRKECEGLNEPGQSLIYYRGEERGTLQPSCNLKFGSRFAVWTVMSFTWSYLREY